MQKCCHRLTALTPHPPSQSASVVSDLYFSLSVTTRVESWEYNSLYTPIISIHILDTVLFTFPMVRTKGICFTIKSLFRLGSFPLFSSSGAMQRGENRQRDKLITSLTLTLRAQKVVTQCEKKKLYKSYSIQFKTFFSKPKGVFPNEYLLIHCSLLSVILKHLNI